jgi:hypothetical protein
MADTNTYITPTALCAERNWSKSKISLLGQPDKTFRIAGSGGKVGSLYLLDRVLEVEEQHSPFKSARRQQAGQLAVGVKREEMLNWVKSLDIKFSIPADITLCELTERGIVNRNAMIPDWKNDADFKYYEGCEAETHVHRWTVNYLRHACTQYDGQLTRMFGKVGVQEAHDALQSKINSAAGTFIEECWAREDREDELWDAEADWWEAEQKQEQNERYCNSGL